MEDRAPTEDRLLVAGQEVMTPCDGSAQRALAFRQVACAAGEELEALGEAFEDRGGSEHPGTRGRELDGERQPFEPRDDRGDGRELWLGRRDIGPDEPGTVAEELDATRGVERPDSVFALTRDPEAFTAGHDDAQLWRGEEQLGDVGRRLRQELLEVVEDKQRGERLE